MGSGKSDPLEPAGGEVMKQSKWQRVYRVVNEYT